MSDRPTTGVAQATPDGELRRQILSQCVANSEREWWAAKTIEKLEFELNAANDRIKRLEQAGDKMASAWDKEWLTEADIEAIIDDWHGAKEAKP